MCGGGGGGGEVCGFTVEEDTLRIPSTKRVSLYYNTGHLQCVWGGGGGKVCAFTVEQDTLRIPSTKRVSLYYNTGHLQCVWGGGGGGREGVRLHSGARYSENTIHQEGQSIL